MRFVVLASGSSGNASLLIEGSFGILLDLGLGPRTLARRFANVGASWDDVHVALLSHVHGDHWNENTLAHLARRNIPLYCHREHATALQFECPIFAELLENDRLCFYRENERLTLSGGVLCVPLPLQHDAGMTCGFRFEGPPDGFGQSWALGYAADLGCWDETLAAALADVDVLAVEFNHDEHLEKNSGRAAALIERVMGDFGHLSNDQAAELVGAVLARSVPGRLQHLVQLHLSRQCNRPSLARSAVRPIQRNNGHDFRLQTAQQDNPGDWLSPGMLGRVRQRTLAEPGVLNHQQPFLPGWEG